MGSARIRSSSGTRTFVKDRSVSFDSVFVFELLRAGDDKTGLNLFRSVIEPRGTTHHIHAEHIRVPSTDRFVPILWEVAAKCEREGLSPILHIDTHGTSIGLGLDVEHPIPWEALAPPLRAINVTSRMNLLVTLAVCHGMAMVRGLNPLEASPVWGLFGPNEIVLEGEVEAGYAKFYTTLLDTLDVNAAVEALRAEANLPDAWQVRSAEFFLAIVYGKYLDARRRPGERRDSERRLVTKLRRRARRNAAPGLPDNARRRLRQLLADEETHFQPIRRRFLMVDLFSENEQRFLLTRDDCVSWWEEQRAAYEVFESAART